MIFIYWFVKNLFVCTASINVVQYVARVNYRFDLQCMCAHVHEVPPNDAI